MRPKEYIGLGARNLLAGLLYFALVFAAGFILGPIRILWLIPSVGVKTAELLEMPVMIAGTLEAEPLDAATTRFRTQTRVLATDDSARRKFRRYWFLFGFGILLIRILSNRAIRRESERQVRSLVNSAGLRDR